MPAGGPGRRCRPPGCPRWRGPRPAGARRHRRRGAISPVARCGRRSLTRPSSPPPRSCGAEDQGRVRTDRPPTPSSTGRRGGHRCRGEPCRRRSTRPQVALSLTTSATTGAGWRPSPVPCSPRTGPSGCGRTSRRADLLVALASGAGLEHVAGGEADEQVGLVQHGGSSRCSQGSRRRTEICAAPGPLLLAGAQPAGRRNGQGAAARGSPRRGTRRCRRGCPPRFPPAPPPAWRSTRSRMRAPAPITSARPGCIEGSARRSATVIATEPVHEPCTWPTGDQLVDGRPVVRRQVEQHRAELGHGPATPTTVAAAAGSTSRRRGASTSATNAATCAAVGGSGAGAARGGAPSRCPSSGPPRAPRVPRISLVEPPPMSTTSTGSAEASQVADRAVEGERRLLRAGHGAGLDAAAPGRRRRRRRRWSPRDAEVATNQTRSAARRGCGQTGVLLDGRERPGERLVGRPVRSRSWPSRTISLADLHVGQSPISSLMVLVPQSIPATHGPASTTARRSSTSSPSGLAPRPCARACPASTCRHLTASAGGDAVDLGDAPGRPARRSPSGGEVALVRAPVGRRRPLVLGQPVLHLLHRPRPRGSRSATRPRARPGSRSSGTACRWSSRGSVVTTSGLPARTAVPDLVDPPGLASQLASIARTSSGSITPDMMPVRAGAAPAPGHPLSPTLLQHRGQAATRRYGDGAPTERSVGAPDLLVDLRGRRRLLLRRVAGRTDCQAVDHHRR